MICLLATILFNCQLSYLHLSVKNSLPIAAINFTQPDAVVTISYANITNNRGYGVYVNTTRSVIISVYFFQSREMLFFIRSLVYVLLHYVFEDRVAPTS